MCAAANWSPGPTTRPRRCSRGLRDYHGKTAPILELFSRKQLVVAVEATQPAVQVQAEIRKKLGLSPQSAERQTHRHACLTVATRGSLVIPSAWRRHSAADMRTLSATERFMKKTRNTSPDERNAAAVKISK